MRWAWRRYRPFPPNSLCKMHALTRFNPLVGKRNIMPFCTGMMVTQTLCASLQLLPTNSVCTHAWMYLVMKSYFKWRVYCIRSNTIVNSHNKKHLHTHTQNFPCPHIGHNQHIWWCGLEVLFSLYSEWTKAIPTLCGRKTHRFKPQINHFVSPNVQNYGIKYVVNFPYNAYTMNFNYNESHLFCPEVQLLCDQLDEFRLGEWEKVDHLVDAAKEFISPEVML